jgi:hypothetical protein
MFGYNLARNALASHVEHPDAPSKAHSASINFVSAAAAGIISATLTNPIWLIKTRLQLQVSGSAAASASAAASYTGMLHCARCIVAEETISMQLGELLKGKLHVIQRKWPRRVSRDLNPLPSGEVRIDFFASLLELLLHPVHLGLEIDVIRHRTTPEVG